MTVTPRAALFLSLHRCKVCNTRWLMWPDVAPGGACWNLLDGLQVPGACCDNVAMGEQIEHLRDIPLVLSTTTNNTISAVDPNDVLKIVRDAVVDNKQGLVTVLARAMRSYRVDF